MNFSLYIAKRYLFSKSSNNSINIMTIIAASGTVIAAAALFIVLSGFAGLRNFSLEFSSFDDPDLKVFPSEGKSFKISNIEAFKIKGIQNYSKTIEERVILEYKGKKQIVTLRGVDENYINITPINTKIYYGNWLERGTDQIVSGGVISNKLSYGVLDLTPQKIYVPKPGKGQITSVKGVFNSIQTNNVGIFSVNEDLNKDFIFSNIETARYLLNYDEDQVTSIDIQLSKNANQTQIINELQKALGDKKVIIKDRAQLNDALYKMLNTENVAVYLIFTLVIIIALFNVIGALIMMILDKKGSINTLFNLGTTTKDIRRIFFLQGSLMTVFSGMIGLLLGFIIIFIQNRFDLIMLTPSLPYPVEIKFINFIIVIVTIIVLGILASKLASQRITKDLVKN